MWYTSLRTDKGDIGFWKEGIGRSDGSCRLCEGLWESGHHLVFECPGTRNIRLWGWTDWANLGEKELWKTNIEVQGVWVLRDCMEVFLDEIVGVLRLKGNR